MDVHEYGDKLTMARAAADHGARLICRAVEGSGRARIVLATGMSQVEMLAALVTRDVPWHSVDAMHLDEYVGLPETHAASFRRYLRERFVRKAPGVTFVPIDADAQDADAQCARLAAANDGPIDVAFIGIGENGHIAFNDPPADFDTKAFYRVVQLDEACRRQQVGEGWFKTLDDVPRRAITMTVTRIMSAAAIVCTVPDARKAEAVRNTVRGPVTSLVPASILRRHARCDLFLDAAAASGLH